MTFAATRQGSATVAFQDVDLDIEEGEFLCIVGPSGCGKTTLLNIIAGLERPTAGVVSMEGEEIEGPSPERGMLFQDYALFPWKTVWDNITFGLRYGVRRRQYPRRRRDEIARGFVDLVGLQGSEGKYPHELSGGMKQRCALARLLANEPEVLLMDEPFGALDAQTRLVLQDELVRVWGAEPSAPRRKTVVFVTHSIDEAVFLADRIVVMGRRPGRIKEIVTVDLPRPRGTQTRAGSRFRELTNLLWDEMRDEAIEAAR
ncbi:ABC transporter ATP-binding protein [Jiangella asiatica]|uniref:ABC transporter ATP-binding protein n=2 Tax=Jiangella asiatica TaxID=2530372 RepID=A0A4R5DVR5_9ACTN|nr:ABC transporter ATP-binding protein [Jiangella asiatica]